MGRVTNSLVAEVITTTSPACWWRRTSSMAAGRMAGRMISSIKRCVRGRRRLRAALHHGLGGKAHVVMDIQAAR